MALEIDPGTTALVIVDIQNVTLAMPTVPHTPPQILANCIRLAEASRQRGVTVVFVVVHVGVGGRTMLQTVIDAPFPSFPVPPEWDRIPAELGPRETDTVVTKYNWGGFYGTDLDVQLRRRGIRTVLLGGIATNFGVESTARQAQEAGYQPVLIEDAMGAFSAEEHAFAIRHIFPRLGRVRSTAEVLAAIG